MSYLARMQIKAPFPYFGGKTAVAAQIWAALGNPKHYIEPFFGSGAVLLSRPDVQTDVMETVNDRDGFVANVWRSLQFSADETARWCDWPVNHADLVARKAALIKNEDRLLVNLCADDKWHDPAMAGYWIWAASCWIGGGLTYPGRRPHISTSGMGVHAIGQIPHISHGGMGVHAIGRIPHIGHGGMGVTEPYKTTIFEHFRQLSERLRYVRVVCGDWTRVCGGNWQDKCGTVGMFFDPPYGVIDRDTNIYHHDSTDLGVAIMTWCLERGVIPTYRIVLAGYEEYRELLNHGWTATKWSTRGGYANAHTGNSTSRGKDNRHRETLYMSPHCKKVDKDRELWNATMTTPSI